MVLEEGLERSAGHPATALHHPLLPNKYPPCLPPSPHTQHAAAQPDSLGCFVRVVANWSYSLFFILGELWGTVAISLLFWGVADDACSVDEAKEVRRQTDGWKVPVLLLPMLLSGLLLLLGLLFLSGRPGLVVCITTRHHTTPHRNTHTLTHINQQAVNE